MTTDPTTSDPDDGAFLRVLAQQLVVDAGERLIERLAVVLSTWTGPLSEGDPEFVAWAVQMIRAYLALPEAAGYVEHLRADEEAAR